LNANIIEMLSNGENLTVEFLPNDASPLAIAKVISAFANTNGGTILLGVKDASTIVGIPPSTATIKMGDVLGMLSSTDIVTFEFTKFRISLDITVITVEKSEKLVFCDSGAYVRVGDKVKIMPQAEISSRINSTENSVESISNALAKQAQTIETFEKTISALKSEVSDGNSFTSKIKDQLIGGVVGAIIGITLTMIGL
jgi:predicted HTH transcriptional regulator